MLESLLTAASKLNGHHKRLIRGMLLALVAILPMPLHGEEPALQPVNWAYSAFFGTGWYGVEGNRSVFALHLPFRHISRSSSLSDDSQRNIGFEIHYPLTIGLHSTDDLPGLVDPDNFGTLIFTPGVIDVPFDFDDTVVIRTAEGNVFKVGEAVDNADSTVTFVYASL